MRRGCSFAAMLFCIGLAANAQEWTGAPIHPDSADGMISGSVRLLRARLEAHQARGEWEDAYVVLRRYTELRDSLRQAYNDHVLAELRATHDLGRKEAELRMMEREQRMMAVIRQRQRDSLIVQELALRHRQTEDSLQELEASRVRREALLLEREHEIQGLALEQRTTERDAEQARLEATAAWIGSLKAEKEYQWAIATREQWLRNSLFAAVGLLLVAGVLGVMHFRHRRMEAVLRADAAEEQARAIETRSHADAAMAARNARNAQRVFSRELLETQERERKRIASELHDTLCQDLSVIKNHAAQALRVCDDDMSMQVHVDSVIETASSALDAVRQLSRELRPYQISQIGLADTLRAMLGKVARSSNIRFAVEIDDVHSLLTKEGEIIVYRLVQESVKNILEHAEAKQAAVRLKRDVASLHLEVEDDGRGFDPSEDHGTDAGPAGLGLRSMAERVSMLGGTFHIDSARGKGTRITIALPLSEHGNQWREA